MRIKENRSLHLLLLCLSVAIGVSLWLGQDASWDLKNYHFYNPHAWIQDRLDIDISPAQLQTYLNPLSDLPYYYLTQAGFSPRQIAVLLAFPAAIALFFLSLIADMLLPAETRRYGTYAVVLVAAFGACGMPVVGSTMSEWHITALFMAAIWLTLKHRRDSAENSVRNRWWVWLLCGLLGGAATGLKLTGAPYAVGLAGLTVAAGTKNTELAARVVLLAAGGLLGFCLTFGPWGWLLWNRFHNPVFPFFNDFFRSPWAEPMSYTDRRFTVKSWLQFATLPWKLMASTTFMVSELSLRDWRLGLGFPALAILTFFPRAHFAELRVPWRMLLGFCAVSYSIWALLFGIYRYAGTLEMIASLAVVAFAANIARKRQILMIAGVAVLTIGTTEWPDWGRAPFDVPSVSVELPALPSNSMVVMASLEPMGYVAANLPRDVPVISLVSNFSHTGLRDNELIKEAQHKTQEHSGPIWLLMHEQWPEERYYDGRYLKDMLLQLGYAAETSKCLPMRSTMDMNLRLCPLARVRPIREMR